MNKIELDWSKLPKEAKYVAVASEQELLWAIEKIQPDRAYKYRWVHNEEIPHGIVSIPFTYSGDWAESLTPKPDPFTCERCRGRKVYFGKGEHLIGVHPCRCKPKSR